MSHICPFFNPFTARVDDGVCAVVLTFTSVVKILWCDHSNEISLEVLSCGVICFKKNFTKWNLGFLSNLPLVIFGSERVKEMYLIFCRIKLKCSLWRNLPEFVFSLWKASELLTVEWILCGKASWHIDDLLSTGRPGEGTRFWYQHRELYVLW